MRQCDKKGPTNFSIDCILSNSDDKSSKSPEIIKTVNPQPVALNKVLENPWISRNPFTFVPGTIRTQNYSSPQSTSTSNSPNFYPDQKFLNYYPQPITLFRNSPGFDNPEKSTNYGGYLNLTTSTTATISTTIIGHQNLSPKYSIPVYETLNIKCDKLKSDNSCEKITEEIYESCDDISEEISKDCSKNKFTANFKCGECFKVFDGLIALNVRLSLLS